MTSLRHAAMRTAPLFAALAVAFVLLCAPASAGAEDAVFYARGKAYELERSTTELAIKLSDRQMETVVADTLAFENLGTLYAPDDGLSSYRIVNVGAANEPTRDAAREITGVEWVRSVYRFPGVEQPLIETGRVVVRLDDRITNEAALDLFTQHGLRVLENINGIDRTYVLVSDDDPYRDLVGAAADLVEGGVVQYAHPDFALQTFTRQATPQDPFFSDQWHLNNTGQEGATAGADISVLEAWTTTLGNDVRVGMFDDCVDTEHEDLASNYLDIGQDILDGDEDPNPGQIGDRHGTAVMGLICAAGNDVGVRGVAPSSRFTASRGVGGFATISAMASVYSFARQQQVDVHNNSWGFGAGIPVPDLLADAIRTVFEEARDGKGMVVLFATGNDGREAPEDMSGLPTVIAVGAVNANDVLTSFSNYGAHVDVVAPSNFGEEAATFLPQIVTTDNTDDAGFVEPGYNFDGFDDFGLPDLPNPNYTSTFGGTSAACPIAAGVASLILSVNPDLSATQVRVIMEHTADRISPEDAEYDAVTGHSTFYGYGRVNAAAAVEAAQDSAENQNLSWPDRVGNVRVGGNILRWDVGADTQNVLVVRSDDIFQWTPEDGGDYSVGSEVADGVEVVFIGSDAEDDSFEFEEPAGTAYFAIFARNNLGRYSWGVLVDSDGNVAGAGPGEDPGQDGEGPGGDDVVPIDEDPAVSIEVFPRAGVSPLTVTFQGNALTDSEIASTTWDFGDGSPPVEQRTTTHEYIVTDGTRQTFVATFTVVDDEGDVGERSVAIDVTSSESGGGGSSDGEVNVSITDTNGNSLTSGFTPLSVRLSVDTEDLPGVFQGILWDLGDGSTASTLTALHTYNTAGTFYVTAKVTTCHATLGCRTTSNPSGVTWEQTSPPVVLQVLPSGNQDGDNDDEDPTAEPDNDFSGLSTGRSATGGACGIGLLPLWLGMLGLGLARRWIR